MVETPRWRECTLGSHSLVNVSFGGAGAERPVKRRALRHSGPRLYVAQPCARRVLVGQLRRWSLQDRRRRARCSLIQLRSKHGSARGGAQEIAGFAARQLPPAAAKYAERGNQPLQTISLGTCMCNLAAPQANTAAPTASGMKPTELTSPQCGIILTRLSL